MFQDYSTANHVVAKADRPSATDEGQEPSIKVDRRERPPSSAGGVHGYPSGVAQREKGRRQLLDYAEREAFHFLAVVELEDDDMRSVDAREEGVRDLDPVLGTGLRLDPLIE